MLNKLLLDLQRDLKPSVIGMTTKCMMTIYHIGNMIVMHGQSTRHAYHNKQKISSILRVELLEGRLYT